MSFDFLVRNAQLRSGITCDIAVKNGRIEQIDRTEGLAQRTIDARGNLVTETFVIPHLHLDKVMTGSLAEEAALGEYHGSTGATMGGAMTAIEMASKVKERY